MQIKFWLTQHDHLSIHLPIIQPTHPIMKWGQSIGHPFSGLLSETCLSQTSFFLKKRRIVFVSISKYICPSFINKWCLLPSPQPSSGWWEFSSLPQSLLSLSSTYNITPKLKIKTKTPQSLLSLSITNNIKSISPLN